MTGACVLKSSILSGSVSGYGPNAEHRLWDCTCIQIVCWSVKLSVATTGAAIALEERVYV